MTEKICSKCKQAKELACFPLYTNKGKKIHRAECDVCRKAAMKRWRDRNRQHIAKYNKEKYWSDPESRRERGRKDYWKDAEKNRKKARERIANPDAKAKRKENMKGFVEKNPDYFKNHRIANKHKYAAHAAKRRHIKRASSANLTEEQIQEMRDIYWLARDLTIITGEPYEVDHIIPIKGKDVCGLHVPWNLQVLPMDLNRAKNNKYSEDKAFS